MFLVGLFAVSRFLLLFLAGRFGLEASRAAEQAGLLLGTLVLVTVLSAPFAHWLSERAGGGMVMSAGALVAAAGIAALAFSGQMAHVLAGILLVAAGSGAFLAANTSLANELVPAVQAAKFKGLANVTWLGAAAVAGLFGPLLDWNVQLGAAKGYGMLFALVTLVFIAGALAARPGLAARAPLGETVTERS